MKSFALASLSVALLTLSGCGGNGSPGIGGNRTTGGGGGQITFGGNTPYKITLRSACEEVVTITCSPSFTGAGYSVTYTGVDSKGNPSGSDYTDNAPTVAGGILTSSLPAGATIQDYKVTVTAPAGTSLPNSGLAGYIDYPGGAGC
jgi:hypothetical protein